MEQSDGWVALNADVVGYSALVADNVEEKLREGRGMKPIRREGRPEGEWVLLDFGDIIVHVFQEASREFYGLERLWADAEKVDWIEPAVAEG